MNDPIDTYDPEDLQEDVNDALDQAIERGYDVESSSVEDIASDLIDDNPLFERLSYEALVPFVERWLETREKGA